MPELRVRIGCVVLAVIMSAVTYYFVEPRLRWGRYGGYKAAGLLSVMVVVGVAGYSVERHDGYTARMNDPDQAVIDAINQRLEDDHQRCLNEISDWDAASHWDMTKCRFQRSAGKNTIGVIGDSHAGHLYPGLITQTTEDEGIAVFPAECAIPLIGLRSRPNTVEWSQTEHELSEGFSYILRHTNISKVVLSHYPGCSWHEVIDTQNPGNHDFESILRDGFNRTYETLTNAGKEIYVVLDNPDLTEIWQKCMASVVHRPVGLPSFLTSKNAICSIQSTNRLNAEANEYWSKIAHEYAKGYENIHFIDMNQVFCTNGRCSPLDDKGSLLYMDPQHLSIKGSMYASSFIIKELRK